MSRSDHGIFDAYAGLIRLVLFALYALYIVVGIVLIVIGMTMAAKGLTGNVALYITLSGISMLFIGAACLVITFFKWWLAMIVLQCFNFALFVFLITTGIIGVFMGSGYSDPIGDAFEEYFDEVRVADGAALDLGICYTLADENDLSRVGKGDSWQSCREVYLLTNPSCTIDVLQQKINDGDASVFDIDIWEDYFINFGNCSALEDMLDGEMEGTTSTTENGEEIFTPTNSIPDAFQDYQALGECQTAWVTSQAACDECNTECMENLATITKKNMTPIAIAMLMFWFFFVFAATINNHIIDYAEPADDGDDDDDDDDGKTRWIDVVPFHAKILCYIFDGTVILLGLILVIFGIAAYSTMNSEEGCPMKKVGKNCPTGAFIVVIFVGLGVMTTGGLVIGAIFLSKRHLVMIANLVFIGICLILLIITIMLGLATGVLATSVTALDGQYIESRNEIRKMCDEDECTLFCAEDCPESEMCANQKFDVPCTGWEGLPKPTGGFADGETQVTQVDDNTPVMCQKCSTFNSDIKCLPQLVCPSDYDDYQDDYLLDFHEFYWGTNQDSYSELDDVAMGQIFPDACVYDSNFQFEDTAPEDFGLTTTDGEEITVVGCDVYEAMGYCTMENAEYVDGAWTNTQGENWDVDAFGELSSRLGKVLVGPGEYEYMSPLEACCACGSPSDTNCGCPENDPDFTTLAMKEVFEMYTDTTQCEWMTVCQYDCEICANNDDNDVRCSEILATDPNVKCGDSYDESAENVDYCSVQGGQIFTNEAGGVPAPDGSYCDDSCEICGYGEIMEPGVDPVNGEVTLDGTGVFYTSASDCIRCADPNMKLNVDLTEDSGTGTCEATSWDYQADLPVPEPCQCTMKWTGCKQYEGPREAYKNMGADDCKEEVQAKVEDYMGTIGTISIIICVIFVCILFLTAIAIDMWRDEEDDGEVEVETKTYVDGVLVDSKSKKVDK